MNDELVTIATFDNSIQANMARDDLKEAGIRAFIADEHMVTTFSQLTNAMGGIKLAVRSEDVDDALKLLEDGKPSVASSLRKKARDRSRKPFKQAAKAHSSREQDAERALKASLIGILLPPLQLYAAWLLLGVCLSTDTLNAEHRRTAWRAFAINVPFLLLWLVVVKLLFFSR